MDEVAKLFKEGSFRAAPPEGLGQDKRDSAPRRFLVRSGRLEKRLCIVWTQAREPELFEQVLEDGQGLRVAEPGRTQPRKMTAMPMPTARPWVTP